RALLVERLALRAVHEPLQHDRAVADPAQRAFRDREVVADDVELRETRLRGEIRLVRVRDPHLAPVDLEDLRGIFLGHGRNATQERWPTRSRTCSTCCATSRS